VEVSINHLEISPFPPLLFYYFAQAFPKSLWEGRTMDNKPFKKSLEGKNKMEIGQINEIILRYGNVRARAEREQIVKELEKIKKKIELINRGYWTEFCQVYKEEIDKLIKSKKELIKDAN
jgi:hypothetical protein